MASVLSLPIPLILLVHLHLLEYPYANGPEYDHNVFDPRVRGLRDRTKSMEDISYFLVSRLEGKKDRAKMILPTYPCLQPSDTTMFRTALAKYLESLRHQALRPVEAPTISADKGKGKGGQVEPTKRVVAWWWKDVVVRKSLLEECSGERFQRLLLSLSTHVLLQNNELSTSVTTESAGILLRTQPQLYTTLLAASQSTQHTWARSASLLLQQKDDLGHLREHLDGHHESSTSSRYGSLSTERVVTLTESKLRDLLCDYRGSHEGRPALYFLFELAGIRPLAPNVSLPSPSNAGVPSKDRETQVPNAPPPPLPIAAAHHPSNLRKLRKPILSQKLKTTPTNKGNEAAESMQPPLPKSHATIALSDNLDEELRMQQALTDAIARAKRVGEDFGARLKELRAREDGRARTWSKLDLDLWESEGIQSQESIVNLKKEPTPDFLASLPLGSPTQNASLESRIDYVRESLLPGFPPIPRPSSSQPVDNVQPKPTLVSRLPQPSKKSSPTSSFQNAPTRNPDSHHSRPQTPKRLGQVLTSTPPETIKPRTTYIRKGLPARSQDKSHIRQASGVPRKSIRYSLAVTRRPSLFVTGSDREENEFDDEVDRIIDAVQDESTSFNDEDSFSVLTPGPKPLQGSRLNILTNTRPSTVKKAKFSFPMPISEPAFALPSLVPLSQDCEAIDGDWASEGEARGTHTTDPSLVNEETEGDVTDAEDSDDAESQYKEGPSMTLRDILLHADTTQFDLLDDDQIHLGDESFDWD